MMQMSQQVNVKPDFLSPASNLWLVNPPDSASAAGAERLNFNHMSHWGKKMEIE